MSDIGHNGSELTDAEWKALKFHHFRAIQDQQEVVDRERGELKRLRKLAKADGLILSDIDFMRKCAEIEDETILTDRLKREAEIASWFALPIQFQADMFDVGLEPLEDRAAREGEAAGYRGKEPTPPYDTSSAAGQAWLKAWHVGNERRMSDLASALEKKAVTGEQDGDELIQGHDADDPFADAEAA